MTPFEPRTVDPDQLLAQRRSSHVRGAVVVSLRCPVASAASARAAISSSMSLRVERDWSRWSEFMMSSGTVNYGAVRYRAAISVSSCLTSRGGSEPVMRDPTLIFDADELLSFLAQTRQSGAHAIPLPTSGLSPGRRSQRQLAAAARRGSWPSLMNGPARPAQLPRRQSSRVPRRKRCRARGYPEVQSVFRLIMAACFPASLLRGAWRDLVMI